MRLLVNLVALAEVLNANGDIGHDWIPWACALGAVAEVMLENIGKTLSGFLEPCKT